MTVKWSTSSSNFDNSQIRKHIVNLRKNLSASVLNSHSNSLFQNIQSLNLDLNNKNIASYLPINGEIDNQQMHQLILQTNPCIYLPIIQNETLAFGAYNKNIPLQANQFKILEPKVNKLESISHMDIVFMPLTAFKKDGNRLGMGGGYYDKTIASIGDTKRPLLIGLAHDFQNHEHFETHPWDIPMDIIVTDKKTYFKKAA